MMEEYLDGPEVDVDLVLSGGKAVSLSVRTLGAGRRGEEREDALAVFSVGQRGEPGCRNHGGAAGGPQAHMRRSGVDSL